MWLNLENIRLSERSQMQKAKQCASPFICNVQSIQVHADRRSITGLVGRRDNGEGLLMGTELLLEKNKLVSKLGGDDRCMTITSDFT
jgi:hypothetical protein